MAEKQAHTPGPWEYVPGTEHHGPYVTASYGGDVADCYRMSNPDAASIRNGGTSFPIMHMGDAAEANARLIASAPALLEALTRALPYVETAEADEAYKPGEVAKVTAMIRTAIRQAEGGK